MIRAELDQGQLNASPRELSAAIRSADEMARVFDILVKRFAGRLEAEVSKTAAEGWRISRASLFES